MCDSFGEQWERDGNSEGEEAGEVVYSANNDGWRGKGEESGQKSNQSEYDHCVGAEDNETLQDHIQVSWLADYLSDWVESGE